MRERRLRTRFPLVWDIYYRILGKRPVIGRGRSINISSSGALVAADHMVSPGTRIQMSIAWPVSHDGIPLELVIQGRVLRNEKRIFAVQFVFANLVPHHRPPVVQDSYDEGLGPKGFTTPRTL
jgi:PilZ domain